MIKYVLAGGCFWCLDAVFRQLKGVENVVCGYSGGDLPTPTYDQVSLGSTGHAESVEVTFDESVISSEIILDIFFLIHDPTTLDRQGNDIGTQYHSAMFFTDDRQKEAFDNALERAKKHWQKPIVTEITPLGMFYPAEEYHQDYFSKNPSNGYCSIVIEPKIIKVRNVYKKFFKENN